jgi:hypothetical protein
MHPIILTTIATVSPTEGFLDRFKVGDSAFGVASGDVGGVVGDWV